MATKTNKKKVNSNIHHPSSSTKVAGTKACTAGDVTDTGVGCSALFGPVPLSDSAGYLNDFRSVRMIFPNSNSDYSIVFNDGMIVSNISKGYAHKLLLGTRKISGNYIDIP